MITSTISKKQMFYNMRINVIRRNCDYLKQMFNEISNPEVAELEKEIEIAMGRVKKLEAHLAYIKLKMSEDQEGEQSNSKLKEEMYSLIKTRMDQLAAKNTHKQVINNLIEKRSNESIRRLLLELESGGNIRIDEESATSEWVSDCENQIKRFTDNSHDKSILGIQIHRISKFCNRNMSAKVDDRQTADGNNEQFVLCQLDDKRFDVISIAEVGFHEAIEERLVSANFCCKDSKQTLSDFPRKAVIARVIVKEDSNSSFPDEMRKSPLIQTGFQWLLPEYLIEYTAENDLSLVSPLEKVLLDIAFSNRILDANMPSIVCEQKSCFVKRARELSQPPSLETDQYYDSHNNYSDDYLDLIVSSGRNCLNLCGFGQLDNSIILKDLVSLTITHASLQNIPSFLSCTSLKNLDLSFNEISKLPKDLLNYFPKLSDLVLKFNSIYNINDLSGCCELEHLRNLDLLFNPVSKFDNFRATVAIKIPQLTSLNGVTIVGIRGDFNDTLTINSSNQDQVFRPLSLRTSFGVDSSSLFQKYHTYLELPQPITSKFSSWTVTIMELDSCKLVNLDLLPLDMPQLKWASFNNNHLEDVTRLSNYTALRELSVSHNYIFSIDCLSSLSQLEKLDASDNRISAVENGDFLSLTSLCLANNLIESLRGISKIVSLCELYIGANQVLQAFTIFSLKDLPNLIILDLSGNEVCKLNNFRLFTVFHLARLKILDGFRITAKELTISKEIYEGKLTIELLGLKIGHFNFKNIVELDLRNCKIKELDSLCGNDFRSLQKLNFDDNLLTNIDCFASLSALTHLSLNRNKIEKLFSFDLVTTPKAPKPFRIRLANLEKLYLGGNNITKISDLFLYRMRKLKILHLEDNKLSCIDGLDQLTSLVKLVADNNQIKSIGNSSFISMENLRELHLKENRIRSLSNFTFLPNLEYLFLSNNRIQEIKEISRMELPAIAEISLTNNSICRKQMYRLAIIMKFPTIERIDGKIVSLDERQRAQFFSMEQSNPAEDLMLPSKYCSPASSTRSSTIKINSLVLDTNAVVFRRL